MKGKPAFHWKGIKFRSGTDSYGGPVWKAQHGVLRFEVREWPGLLPKTSGGRPAGIGGRYSAELYYPVPLQFADTDGWIEWASSRPKALEKLWGKFERELHVMFKEAERLEVAAAICRRQFKEAQ